MGIKRKRAGCAFCLSSGRTFIGKMFKASRFGIAFVYASKRVAHVFGPEVARNGMQLLP